MQKPIVRSALRIWAGKIYYKVKKTIYWHLSGIKFAQSKCQTFFPYELASHKSTLLRKLKDIDMWIQYNKVKNLQIALEQVNGLIIQPGEIFSYWRQIGRPSKKKGYCEGMILRDGKVLSGIGGGLCQLSNLLYWITIHTPLTIKERWRHSYDVFPDAQRTQPFGSGATCAYPAIDLQIQNDTKQQFQLKLWMDDHYLYGSWLSDKDVPLSYEIIEKDHIFKSEWRGGYSRHNKIFRKVTDKDTHELLTIELVTENHAIMMYNPMLEQK